MKTVNKKCDKCDNKISSMKNNIDLNDKLEFLERSVDNIKHPRENELSSVKGEFKVFKQKVHDIKAESENNTFQCNGMKNSITQLRSRLNSLEKNFGEIESNKSDNSITSEQLEIINAKVNLITEEISKLNRSRRSEISSGEHDRQSYQQSSTRAPPTKMFHRIPPVEAPQPPSSSPSTSSPSSSSPSSSSPSSSTSHRLARQEDASPDVITCTPPQQPETHKKQSATTSSHKTDKMSTRSVSPLLSNKGTLA